MFDAFKIDQFDVLGEGEPVPAAFAGEIQREWEVAEPFGEGRGVGVGRQVGGANPPDEQDCVGECLFVHFCGDLGLPTPPIQRQR